MKNLVMGSVIISALAGCSITSNMPDKVVLHETSVSKNQKIFRKILLVGSGQLSARLFYEKLFPFMQQQFLKHDVASSFVFLSAREYATQVPKGYTDDGGYDGLLVMVPPGYSHTSASSGAANNPNANNKCFDESVRFTLFERGKPGDPVWEATVDLQFPFDRNTIYPRLTQMIMQRLLEKNFLN